MLDGLTPVGDRRGRRLQPGRNLAGDRCPPPVVATLVGEWRKGNKVVHTIRQDPPTLLVLAWNSFRTSC